MFVPFPDYMTKAAEFLATFFTSSVVFSVPPNNTAAALDPGMRPLRADTSSINGDKSLKINKTFALAFASALCMTSILLISALSASPTSKQKLGYRSWSRGDCKALLRNSDSYCDSGDCKAILRNSDSYCDTNDCKAILRNSDSYCKSSDC